MKDYLKKHRRVMGFSFGLLAFAVAAVYLKVTPEEASTASGVQRIILAYGHSLCWVLLGAASLLWGANKEARLLAYAALAAYVLFIITVLVS